MSIENWIDVVDSRDVIARIAELEERTMCDNCGKPAVETVSGTVRHSWTQGDSADEYPCDPELIISPEVESAVAALADPLDEDELEELRTLRDLASEGESNAGEWADGATLIRDSYFEDYAREMAEEIGAVSADAAWPVRHIDWPAAASELKQDYSSVDFDGETFWVRS